jgi:hypothetical protein
LKDILIIKDINKTIFIKTILLIIVVLLLTSCHSRYVYLDYEVHHGPMWNNGHTCVAFVASKTAFRSATGIAKFPDGGIPDYLLKDVGLYVFSPENHQLTQLVNFNDLTDCLGTSCSNWRCEIAFTDSLVYYNLLPVMGWDWYLKKAKTTTDSLLIRALKEKYTRTYSFNIIEKKVTEIDSSLFLALYQKCNEANKADLTGLNKILSEVPLADWGLVVKEIYPRSDKDYITETIYRRNNSLLTRRAVVEQIISKMNRQETKDLLRKMDEYKNSLEGLKKTEYEIYSKDTYEMIKGLQ